MPCRLTTTATVAAPPLIQIRRRYAAAIGSARLLIEGGGDGWTAKVADGERILYSARRCSVAAAKTAATEYVMLGIGGFAGAVCWTESYAAGQETAFG